MVPTDPPRLEDRNVRWCHCACREPHLSPVPRCSAWGSCSRGRTRWREWKWQERLLERGDKYLWQLLLNKYLSYLGSDSYHFNEFKLTSFHARISTSPCPSRQKARAQSQTWGKHHLLWCSKALLPGWTLPQLLCVSPRPPNLTKPRNLVLHSSKASLQWHNVLTRFYSPMFSLLPSLNPLLRH